jgi:peptide/nickel transport system permease protein
VLSYCIRRLLWMIPTLVGILIINFAILRLDSTPLNQMAQQDTSDKGNSIGRVMRDQASYQATENFIARFWHSGNNLPALVNVRGFLSKESVCEDLQTALDQKLKPTQRLAAQNRLWLLGPFAVKPLAEILQDDHLVALHGAASVAFTFCAFIPLNVESLKYLSDERQDAIRRRNEVLRKARFPEGLADPDYASKRAQLLAVYQSNLEEYSHSPARQWGAMFTQTGFVDFLGKLFTGNLWSESRGDYVFTIIGHRWYVTFWLNLTSIVISWVISVIIGIRSARIPGSHEDRITTSVLFLLWSVPSFFAGTLLLHHFCTNTVDGVAIFPSRGLSSEGALWFSTPEYLWDLIKHAFLPVLVLCYSSFTLLSRYMRANVLSQLSSDYVRSARAKGCSEDAVVYRHAVPNSMITMITLGSGLLADLFGSSVFVEMIFSIPGLGLLLFDAAKQTDGPLLMGSTLISVVLLLVGILIADLLYAWVDPRIREKYV